MSAEAAGGRPGRCWRRPPSAFHVRLQKQAPTFEAYIEPFWSDYARHWKPLAQSTNRGIIERELKPVFGFIVLDRIKRSDVMHWRDEMNSRPASSIARYRCWPGCWLTRSS